MATQTAKLNKKTDAGKTKPVADKAKPTQLVRASARSLRLAPRKMRLVTNLVKNMRVADALTQLQFTNKKGAKMLTKLLLSATANAENNFSLNRDDLYIKSLTCDMGPVLQRSFPRARGSAFIIRHKLSHVNVVLEERPSKGKKSRAVVPKPVKKEKVEEAKTTLPEIAAIPDAKVKETHHENESGAVKAKTKSENLIK